jgi:hypothetical protein
MENDLRRKDVCPMDRMVVVTSGELSEGVQIAVQDLIEYLRKCCQRFEVVVKREDEMREDDRRNNLLVAGDSRSNLLNSMKKDLGLSDRQLTEQSFSIRTAPNPYADNKTIVLLEGCDKLGLQYACYDFAERVLGVRYLSPGFEYIPELQEINIPYLDIHESPGFKHRGIWVFHYGFDNGRGGNWVDPYEWWENRDKDITMLKKTTDWAIKNKQDFICWLGDLGPRLHEFAPKEHIDYEVMRGIYTVAVVNPSSSYGFLSGDQENFCTHDPDYHGFDPDHLCIETERFWQAADEYIEQTPLLGANVLGVLIYFGESTCSGLGYCGCKRCGHIPNWEKYVKVASYVREKLKEKGINLPVGISRGASAHLGPFGDREFAERIVSRLSEDGFCSVRTLMDHSWEEVGAWFDLVNERNMREGSRITVWKEAENLYMCGSSDIPLVSVFYYETREKDFQRLSKDPLVELHHTNVVTTHFMEWLKNYYTIKCQWKYVPGWKDFVEKELSHVFGQKTGDLITGAMENLLKVEKMERRPDVYDFKQVDFVIKGGYDYKPEYARVLGIGVAGWCYASNIILDLKLTEGISNEEEFKANLDRVENDVNYYLESVNKAYADTRAGLESCQKCREYFREEIFNPMEWTCLFLRFRLYVVKAYCSLLRAKEQGLGNNRKNVLQVLGDALTFMDHALDDLRDYNRKMPYYGWDLAVNPGIKVIEEMEEELRDLRVSVLQGKVDLRRIADIDVFKFIRIEPVTWEKVCEAVPVPKYE